MSVDVLEAAKQALAVKDWQTARRILAPLVAENPSGMPGFLLARAELELGRPEVAGPLVTAFRAHRPRHVGSALLAARVHLAGGNLDRAADLARTVLELEHDNQTAVRLLERIEGAAATAELAEQLALVDAGYRDARTGDPGPALLAAAERLHDAAPGPDWTNDVDQAKAAYFQHARDVRTALRSYDPHLIDVATRFDHLSWPRRIQSHLGNSVLDVGCGLGAYGMGYLVAGAGSYTGIDPAVDLDSARARNRRVGQWDDMGVTPRQIMEANPAIRIIPSAVESHVLEGGYDTIVLHNASEHVADIAHVLAVLADLCHPDSRLVLLHHNFYSWNGHKRQPRTPGQYDARIPEHERWRDWRHVNAVPDLPEDHEMRVKLNRIRLDDLRSAIERHFTVSQWEEAPSDAATCARLTPTVLDRVREAVSDVTERELTVNNVFCVAGPK
jgi:SAM-dependent methyltransferase